MGVSKVVLGDETLIDLTGDSVSSENLLQGETAHGADGEEITGGVIVTPMYTGTKTAIEEAIAAGQIPEDAIVNITDDEETSSFQSQINQINNSLSKINTYVDEDGKLHFVDSEGADTVLPFSSGISLKRLCTVYETEDRSVIEIAKMTITKDNDFDKYISYDSSTGKFTVLQAFVGYVIGWVKNYRDASSTCGQGQIRINGTSKTTYSTPTRYKDSTSKKSAVEVSFSEGDMFDFYEPSTNGYAKQYGAVFMGDKSMLGMFTEIDSTIAISSCVNGN